MSLGLYIKVYQNLTFDLQVFILLQIWRMCWFAEEISTSHFGDKRLSHRFLKMLQQLSKAPASSVPEALHSHSETLAAYRFWNSDLVNDSKILAPHLASTLNRISGMKRVLAIQDTSEFDFTTHESNTGLGYLESDKQFGIKYHPLFIASPAGVQQGLLAHNFWTCSLSEYGKKRERQNKPIEEKESYRWLETVNHASYHISSDTEIINIADREADIYELFVMERTPNSKLLIRVSHNRSLQDKSQQLFKALEDVKDCGHKQVTIGQRKGQSTRKAQLNIRYTRICLMPPQKKTHLPSVELTAIEVYEPSPPNDAKPVRWVLLTDMDVNSTKDIFNYVQYYSLRWLIDRYFFTLKSGCKVEDLQLESVTKLKNAIATYSIIAIKLMFAMYESRNRPEQTCEVFLQPKEWIVLYWLTHKKPPKETPPTLAEVILWIAKLGGFLGRKSDGLPGIKTLWRGYKRLNDAVNLYDITQSYQ